MTRLFLIGLLAIASYNVGYLSARKHTAHEIEAVKREFFEGPEGYCLVEMHPGQCIKDF